jgi:hypothetical protein
LATLQVLLELKLQVLIMVAQQEALLLVLSKLQAEQVAAVQ